MSNHERAEKTPLGFLAERLIGALPPLRDELVAYYEEFGSQAPLDMFIVWALARTGGRSWTGQAGLPPVISRDILSFLEGEYGNDSSVDRWIDVALKCLPRRDEPGGEVLDALGPRLRSRWEEFEEAGEPDLERGTSQEDLDFVQRMIVAVPSVRAEVEGHLGEFDELLPTILFGVLAKKISAIYKEGIDSGSGPRSDVVALLRFLESEFRGADDEVANTIQTGFLEGLPLPDEAGFDVAGMLPPKLREFYIRYELTPESDR